jgi:L-ascorbate metabolism protein UlaG (beta-lactamase superfamily)
MSTSEEPPNPRRRIRHLWTGLKIAALFAMICFGVGIWVLTLAPFGGNPSGERLARARANPLYHDGAFANAPPPGPPRALSDNWTLLKLELSNNEVRVPPSPIPVVTVDARALRSAPPRPGLRAFWIGHASLYVEIDGLRLLVDPVFSEYASPVEFGPRRFHPPPIALSDLPPIDAVLITHDHYDHLDMSVTQQLAGRGTAFHVPLGIGAHLERWGVPSAQIHEYEWWQERPLRGVRIVSTPARHYSGRALNRNSTLWTSWSVIGTRHRFYISGDTGYADHFRAIGEKLGPFDLSFIKVGAYGPGAPWADIHMSAEDAVQAHLDVRAKRMVPVHWGTFNLAFHSWDEPIRRTVTAARAHAVDVVTPRVGEFVDADRPFTSIAWWQQVR